MSLETARRVLRIEAQAIQDVLARLDQSFERAVDLLLGCEGRVVVTGMGKSGLIGRKISATLSSTGTPSFFLHPADALHGDLGMLARGDSLLAITYGGETPEILNLLETLKRLEIPIVTLTGNVKSTLAEASDVVLDVSVKEEACSLNLAPTASTTVAMAVGDALAVALLDRRGFCPDDFAALHPAGRLGQEIAARGALDAFRRGHSACEAVHVDAGCVSRNVGEKAGYDYGGDAGRTACGNLDRRRFAAIDGKAWRGHVSHDRWRLHGGHAADDQPATAGQRSFELDGEEKDHFGGCGG